MTRTRILSLGFALALAGCSDNELEDPTFEVACQGDACTWKVEEGSVREVSTWSKHDKALELVSTPTVLSQRVTNPLVCDLQVEVFGFIEDDARLTVGIDLGDDGTVDVEVPIQGLEWDSTTLRLDASTADDAPWRLVFHKRGPGRAVLGHVIAEQCPIEEQEP